MGLAVCVRLHGRIFILFDLPIVAEAVQVTRL